ncbi:MAG: tRNA pseudouridine(55) synthase TruB [Turneriella sp.]|nr:tRNA pseudouridine(55) synthase TruB [Turneriella sp.]
MGELLGLRGPGFGAKGILEPLASGLLLAAKGNSTRFLSYFSALPKTYKGLIVLGSETDTLDSTGSVVKTSSVPPLTAKTLQLAAARFLGTIQQIPPLYSNARIAGHRAHELARKGIAAELKPRQVTIHSLELSQADENQLFLHCTTSAGTYIRALARDIAQALGTCGYLLSLRRLAIGIFRVSEEAPSPPGRVVRELEAADALYFFPTLELTDNIVHALRSGRRPPLSAPPGIYRLFAGKNFIGLGKVEKGKLQAEKLLPNEKV